MYNKFLLNFCFRTVDNRFMVALSSTMKAFRIAKHTTMQNVALFALDAINQSQVCYIIGVVQPDVGV